MNFNYQVQGEEINEGATGGFEGKIKNPVKITFTIEMDKKEYEKVIGKKEIPGEILELYGYKGF